MRPIRSIFISDVHLGYSYSQVDALHAFLKDKQPEFLYLVGDIVDGWKFQRKKWLWNDHSNLLIRRILGFVRRGGKVFYAIGNHDEFLRKFIHNGQAMNFGHLYFANEFIHRTADGRKLLVVHGDAFDAVIQYAPWMAWIGDVGYETLMHLNHFVNMVRRWMGYRPWSFSKFAKMKVKEANSHIAKFESYLAEHARKMGCNGVICGHIHCAVIDQRQGMSYMNCGDWVESCTALIEYQDGTWEIYDHFKESYLVDST